MLIIRSLIFDILFYSVTALTGLICIPMLVLPRMFTVRTIMAYEGILLWLEKHILGLKREIRGAEHLPDKGPFILAMKHQSAYETLHLHHQFGDIAIIMKRELMWIPIWGWIASKAHNVAIDRGKGRVAMESILRNAGPVFAANRILAIFPQGTRVGIHQTAKDKPYKIGVGKIYERHNMPIVPIAINAGVYWPKGAFIKKPGTVVFEVQPIIPAGLPVPEMMEKLETVLETRSNALVQEALALESAKAAKAA